MTTTTDPEQAALARLDQALAHLHVMEPADAGLVVQRLLEDIARARSRAHRATPAAPGSSAPTEEVRGHRSRAELARAIADERGWTCATRTPASHGAP